MKLGVRAHDYGRRTIENMAKTLSAEGFQAAQLVLPKAFTEINSYAEINEFHLETISKVFSEYKMDVPVFGCYMDLGNPDADVRKNAIANFRKCLGYAKRIGAKTVGTETACAVLSQEQKKIWYPYMLDSIQRVMEEAQKIDMQVAIEPVQCHPLENLDVTMEIIHMVDDSKHLRLIFDPVNVLKNPLEVDQKQYWSEWMDIAGDYIDVLHMKDIALTENGSQLSVSLGDGLMQYEVIGQWLKKQTREIYLIREGLEPSNAKKDLEYMTQL